MNIVTWHMHVHYDYHTPIEAESQIIHDLAIMECKAQLRMNIAILCTQQYNEQIMKTLQNKAMNAIVNIANGKRGSKTAKGLVQYLYSTMNTTAGHIMTV